MPLVIVMVVQVLRTRHSYVGQIERHPSPWWLIPHLYAHGRRCTPSLAKSAAIPVSISTALVVRHLTIEDECLTSIST